MKWRKNILPQFASGTAAAVAAAMLLLLLVAFPLSPSFSPFFSLSTTTVMGSITRTDLFLWKWELVSDRNREKKVQ